MKKTSILVLSLLLSVQLLTGCWNRLELNELGIVGGMSIDKKNGKQVVTTQVINPGQVAAKQGKGQEAPVITYREKGDTIFEAIRRMAKSAARRLYFSHLRILVIGEDLAKDGIGNILDFVSRNHEFRPDFFIVIAKKTKAEDALRVLTALEEIPANKLFSALETSEKVWAPSITLKLDKLISDTVNEGINPHVTGLRVIGSTKQGQRTENIQQSDPEVKLKYDGMAIFKDNKLIGWMNEKDSKAANYVLGDVKSTIQEVFCSGGRGKAAIEVIHTKADVSTKLKNGSLKGNVQINVEANVGEVQCNLDLTNSKTLDYLEKRANKRLKQQIAKVIKKTQKEFKSDIYGFGEALHRSHPNYWKKVKGNWNEKFTTMPIKVQTNIKIHRVGMIGKPHDKSN
ncbi:Ger(x)C family spore germination protein [Bacillus changyiensis]|uniref:Ger(x)C family spore germination protein n=1 Tax=Bacillus changyiensis TaxID=3004103 RepID=UPI0022E6C1FA|nr:Ger(x)C family spore germination protein [Bacillus changyiensis]MDA1475097.1 Ger(x)C family spore germination protein [Bacillus changyiensis]